MQNFIETNGKTPNLVPETKVEVLFYNGLTCNGLVKTWVWDYDDQADPCNYDIVAYRILK